MMRFSFKAVYVEGKRQITADALSRATVSHIQSFEEISVLEVEEYATQALKV